MQDTLRSTRWPDRRLLALAVALPLLACHEPSTAPETPSAPDLAPELATAGTWTARAPLPSARAYHAAAVVTTASGQTIMYVMGGRISQTKWVEGTGYVTTTATFKDNLAYNPATNVWTARAPMPARRFNTNGAAVLNGKIYVSGGANSVNQMTNTLFVYDPVTNTWTTKAPLPDAMVGGVMVAYSGKLYVLASRDSECRGCTTDKPRFFRYDPATNSWTRKANAPGPPRWTPAGAVIGTRLYVAGGSATGMDFDWPEDRLDIYDFSTNTWSQGAPYFVSGPGVTALNGKLYVIGKTTARYDPSTNTWTQLPSLPSPRTALTVNTVVRNGVKVILAVGGYRSANRYTFANVDQYTP